ncbi:MULTISPECIES: lipopolysaccharide biosynthesis protein [Microbacterium]|jgi:O-antigen/teichoic acid export membrane protein|uniref:lipopolysaccharide biosynthesis protein n=1 Tax=Microbacterium TaxID=33882 RepID=UPI001D173C95|nr:lipopolysaccharide biosynthesis protein [Microbacterium testaceum]MCC4248613.1 lipopolysaccharide biosynthesis protein [Microbacterium testaceum]
MTSLAGAAARGAAHSLLAQFLRFVIQFGALMVLARLLTPGDYGTVALVTSITGLALLLADFGLSSAAIQARDITHQQKSNLFWLNTVVGLVVSVVVFFAAYPISWFYGRPELVAVAQALSVVFLLYAVTAQFRAEASKALRFKAMAIADVAAQFISFAAAIVFALMGATYWALVLQQVLSAFLLLVMLWVASRWTPTWPSRRADIRPLVSFGVNNLGVQLVTYASNNVDSVLIGRFWGVEQLGLYSRAYQLYRLPLQQLAAPMTRVAFPVLSKIEDDATFQRYVRQAQLLQTYVIGGVFFAATALCSPLVEIVLGPDWDETKSLFAVLAIGGVFQTLGYVYYWVFLAKALTGMQLRYTLVSRSIMILLMFAGVPWGAIGVAVGMTAGLLLNWAILTFRAMPKAGLAPRPIVIAAARPVALYTTMLVVAAPVIWLTWNLAPWWQILAIGGTIALFLLIAYALVPTIRQDTADVLRMAKRIRR